MNHQSIRSRLTAFALAGALAFVPATIHAQVVFDGGAPDGVSGNEMTQWIQAEDFALSNTTNISAITFWAAGQGGDTWLGTVAWAIYSDAAGPGGLLFSGVQAGTRAVDGTAFGNTQYRHTLAVAFQLGAGSYWLGLHNGPLSTTTRAAYYWSTTSSGYGLAGQEDNTPFGVGGWSGNGQDHAFFLEGSDAGSTVPEPATMTLLATGLAGMAAARRKKSRG